MGFLSENGVLLRKNEYGEISVGGIPSYRDDAHATHGEEGRKFITSDIVSGVPYFPGWALRARQTLSPIASKF